MKYIIYNKKTNALVTSINKTKFANKSFYSWRNIFNSRRITKNPAIFSLIAAREFLKLNGYHKYSYKIRPL